jgi:hypothetical protein
MFKRKRRSPIPGINQSPGKMPENTPIEKLFRASNDFEEEIGVLEESSLKAAKSRTGLLLRACRRVGVRRVGDLKKPGVFRRINKEIEKLSGTRAQANNLKSTFRKGILNNIELGNISLKSGAIRGVKEEKNIPCAPTQLTDQQIEFYLRSKKGRSFFLATRNDLIAEFELLYGIRPGKEITGIDDENVHPDKGYMNFCRKDGLFQRLYLRRDTCDRIKRYRHIRGNMLHAAGEKGPVIPFFTKERAI